MIAAESVRILHAAGIPAEALQLLPGGGAVGAALASDRRVAGVMFTGSTAVARLIQRQLAERLSPAGQPAPLIAETGGQNAMVVDSSALAEQVVADVIASAFDSAGQRCSALRILCLQDDIAARTLAMLKGAMRELSLGNPDRLATDVGPVISPRAQAGILEHIETMRGRGHAVEQIGVGADTAHGTFVPPTLIEIARVADVEREVFGPVLHVLRFPRAGLDALIRDINATGYGLTFGLHTRIDETIARVTGRIDAGNLYINRNIIGASVGVQPFGGSGLSGTGPKAGGPLYLGRLLARPPRTALDMLDRAGAAPAAAHAYAKWLRAQGHVDEAAIVDGYLARSALGAQAELPGPAGERNVYALRPRGAVAALARSEASLLLQVGAILATGNTAMVEAGNPARRALATLPPAVAAQIAAVESLDAAPAVAAVLFDGAGDDLIALNRRIARRDGPLLQIQLLAAGGDCDLERLLEEVSTATNTAAAGGNASLMSIG